MEKLAERTWLIVGKRRTLYEAPIAIKVERGLKGWSVTSFQAQFPPSARSCLCDHEVKQVSGNSATQMIWMSSHGFQLTAAAIQLFKCTHAYDPATLANRPYRYLGSF